MTTLIERLKAATGPDRELDAEIHVRVNGWKLAPVPKDYDGLNEGETYTPDGEPITGFAYPPKGKIGLYYHVPRGHGCDYTDRVESAEWISPTSHWELKSLPHRGGYSATVFMGEKFYRAEHTRPALALVIACLMARGER
jgi:hypothetical protein